MTQNIEMHRMLTSLANIHALTAFWDVKNLLLAKDSLLARLERGLRSRAR